jgi:RNA polymerase sigma-70 factor (ECF subfamily)
MADRGPPSAVNRTEGRSDEALLRAFAGGERGALGELAARYERSLLGFARGVLRSEDLACDAVQEAWVRVIRHAETFRGRSSFKTWMYRIVINRCNDIRSGAERRGLQSVGTGRRMSRMRGREGPKGRSSMGRCTAWSMSSARPNG